MKKTYTTLNVKTGALKDFTSIKAATDYTINNRWTMVVLNVKALARLRAEYNALQKIKSNV